MKRADPLDELLGDVKLRWDQREFLELATHVREDGGELRGDDGYGLHPRQRQRSREAERNAETPRVTRPCGASVVMKKNA